MQNLSKRIEKLEDRLSIGSTENSLEAIVRVQACLSWYYSHKDASQQEMVEFAKENSTNEYQYKANLDKFIQLTDEAVNGRRFEARQGGLR